MPVYEYVCKECGNHTEVSQSFKDEPLTTCGVCGGPVRKVFNSIGIVLKGSGFYRTDSRMPSKAEKADKGEKKADKEKAGATSETKAGDSKGSSESKAPTSESSSSSSSSSTTTTSSSSSTESKSSKSA